MATKPSVAKNRPLNTEPTSNGFQISPNSLMSQSHESSRDTVIGGVCNNQRPNWKVKKNMTGMVSGLVIQNSSTAKGRIHRTQMARRYAKNFLTGHGMNTITQTQLNLH